MELDFNVDKLTLKVRKVYIFLDLMGYLALEVLKMQYLLIS